MKPGFLLAIDFNDWTTYVKAGVAGIIGYLLKTVVEQGKDIAAIKYYIERRTKDAAEVLNTPNPTPRDMKALLDKHIKGGTLASDERVDLINWLRTVSKGSDTSKRGAAMQFLTGLETARRMNTRKWWQQIFLWK